ncbi:hypothetical protein ALC60_12652, partial [Trachymyrmex zeteki]
RFCTEATSRCQKCLGEIKCNCQCRDVIPNFRASSRYMVAASFVRSTMWKVAAARVLNSLLAPFDFVEGGSRRVVARNATFLTLFKDNERSNGIMSPYVLLIHCNERLMAWHFSYCQFYQWHKACNYSYFPNSADLCKPEYIECLHRYPTPIMRNTYPDSNFFYGSSRMRNVVADKQIKLSTSSSRTAIGISLLRANEETESVHRYNMLIKMVTACVTLLLDTLRNIPIFAAPPQWHPHCTMAPTCQRLLMSVAATAMCGIALGLPSLELQTNAITLLPYRL